MDARVSPRATWTRQILLAGLVAAAIAMWPGACARNAPPSGAGNGKPEHVKLDYTLKDMSGKDVRLADYVGKPIIINFWATWCPPCRATLAWLAELEERRGGDLAVVAIAVESPEDAVRKFAASSGGGSGIRWAIGDAAVAKAFGEVAAVPALFLFGRDGREIRTFYGAPPDLHEQIEKALAAPSARPIS
jgi:thiol-disulfide isomerase/thioredoxin